MTEVGGMSEDDPLTPDQARQRWLDYQAGRFTLLNSDGVGDGRGLQVTCRQLTGYRQSELFPENFDEGDEVD